MYRELKKHRHTVGPSRPYPVYPKAISISKHLSGECPGLVHSMFLTPAGMLPTPNSRTLRSDGTLKAAALESDIWDKFKLTSGNLGVWMHSTSVITSSSGERSVGHSRRIANPCTTSGGLPNLIVHWSQTTYGQEHSRNVPVLSSWLLEWHNKLKGVQFFECSRDNQPTNSLRCHGQ